MDPISASTAIAAVGAANNATKGGIAGALLGPLAKAYGEDWGERARERLERAKLDRRSKNLEDHLERSRDQVRIEQIDPNILEQWAIEVSGVDPADTELSDAWAGLLREIATSNPYRLRLLKVLSEMSADEVLHFLNGQKSLQMPPEYRRRLVELGLLRSSKDTFIASLRFMLPMAIMLSAAGAAWAVHTLNLPSSFGTANPVLTVPFIAMMGVASTIGVVGSYWWIMQSPRPTALGRAFLLMGRAKAIPPKESAGAPKRTKRDKAG